MKDANVNTDFVIDICISKFSFEHKDHENKSEALLSLNDMKSKGKKLKVSKKLHRQFGHQRQ